MHLLKEKFGSSCTNVESLFVREQSTVLVPRGGTPFCTSPFFTPCLIRGVKRSARERLSALYKRACTMHAPDKLLLFPSSPLQASFPFHCNPGKLSKPPVSPIFSRSQQEWGSAPQPSAACAAPCRASDTSRSLGRSVWPAGPATHVLAIRKNKFTAVVMEIN